MSEISSAASKLFRAMSASRAKELMAQLLMRNTRSIERYLGVHIAPVHFYSPIPALQKLDPGVFDKIYDCTGIDWNVDEQVRHAREVFPAYIEEFTPPVLPSFDSFILYSMIRERKPRIMIEVGAGGSTAVSLAALEQNRREGHDFELYSIDPFPRDDVREIRKPGFSLLAKKVQDVDLDLLSKAELLFIDSSHVCKCDSDVNFLMLELVPRLRVGAVIQWHDIMIPNDYPKKWLDGGLFYNESYVLHAFMLFNKAFKILWASRYMHVRHPAVASRALEHLSSLDTPENNVSFWIERVG